MREPYTYLEYARAMPSFYAAHRREPRFPYARKVALALLHDDDEAVSVASAVFSTLTIAATVALGWYGWSLGMGLIVGSGVAIDYDPITPGVDGRRDDDVHLRCPGVRPGGGPRALSSSRPS